MELIGDRDCITFSVEDDCADVSASDIQLLEERLLPIHPAYLLRRDLY